MDNEELISHMKVEVELAVANGMQRHRIEDHDPLWNELKEIQKQVNAWRGAFGVIIMLLTLAVGAMAAFHF